MNHWEAHPWLRLVMLGREEGLYVPVVCTLLDMKKEAQFQPLRSVQARGFWSQKALLNRSEARGASSL